MPRRIWDQYDQIHNPLFLYLNYGTINIFNEKSKLETVLNKQQILM